MYRAGIEGLLGLTRTGQSLTLDPCFPKGWPQMQATLTFAETKLEITILNPGRSGHGIMAANLDGEELPIAHARLTLPRPLALSRPVQRLTIRLRD